MQINTFENLHEIGNFLKKCNSFKMMPVETSNFKRSVFIEVIEKIITELSSKDQQTK